MVRILITTILLFASSTLIGQFGFGLNYQSIAQPYGFADSLEAHGGKFSSPLLGGSILYWFRLKNRRVEFLPELGFLTSLNKPEAPYDTRLRKLSLSFNTDIYLFDLEGDCNCPTFSKQGGYFQKSFFIQVTPGIDIQDFFLKMEEGVDFEDYEDSGITFRIGLGAGFDFGISDMITITPTVGVNWSSGTDWHAYFLRDTTYSQGGELIFSAGLRALFRPDYKRRFR